MKKIKFLSLIATLILFITACETDVVDPAGDRGVAPAPGIENLNPATFDVYDLENTYIQFTLVLNDPKVNEAKIVASFKGNQKRVEVASVTSFPSTIKITLKEVATKLGMQLNDVVAADVFNFEVQTLLGGKVYYSNAAFNAAVVCGYDIANVTGSYHALSDDWGFDDDVEIVADPDDDYVLYVHGLAAAEGLDEIAPLKLEVNKLNFSVTAVKTVLAPDVASWGLPYTGFFYEGSGELNTCDGTYTMNFTIGVDQGTWGLQAFVFTKN